MDSPKPNLNLQLLGYIVSFPVYLGYFWLSTISPMNLRIIVLGSLVIITNIVGTGVFLLLRTPIWGRYFNIFDLLAKCFSLGSVFEVLYLHNKPFFFTSPFLWGSNTTFILPIVASTYIAIKYRMNFFQDVFQPWVITAATRLYHAVHPLRGQPRRKIDQSFRRREPQ